MRKTVIHWYLISMFVEILRETPTSLHIMCSLMAFLMWYLADYLWHFATAAHKPPPPIEWSRTQNSRKVTMNIIHLHTSHKHQSLGCRCCGLNAQYIFMVIMQNCQDPNHAKQKSVREVWQPIHQYTDLASVSLICQYQLSPPGPVCLTSQPCRAGHFLLTQYVHAVIN